MKKILQFCLIILAFTFAATQAEAQKIGHLDTQSIVFEMPEFKQARSNLDAMASQFKKQLQSQQEKIQTRLIEAEKKFQRGELAPAEQKKIESELQAENQKLLANEQKYQEDLLKKEEESTAPLYEKIRKAISDVAKENGYNYVMEAASLLYSVQSDDLTSKVKAKLGM